MHHILLDRNHIKNIIYTNKKLSKLLSILVLETLPMPIIQPLFYSILYTSSSIHGILLLKSLIGISENSALAQNCFRKTDYIFWNWISEILFPDLSYSPKDTSKMLEKLMKYHSLDYRKFSIGMISDAVSHDPKSFS